MSNIAVIGATGFLGTPVAHELVTAGFNVTALVRNDKKARSLKGIHIIKGDLWKSDDLDRLLSGQDALYLSLNIKRSSKPDDKHTEREGLELILAAAKKHGIRRVGFLSSLVMSYQGMNDFNWWVFELKKQAVDRIKSSGIPTTIFYPSTFMDNFEVTYRMGNRVLLSGFSKHKMYFIAAADFGRQVAQAFREPSNKNKDYIIQGPDGFTADEAAEEYVRYSPNKELKISRAPLGLLKFIGKFSQEINYGYHIIEALNNYPEKFQAEQTWKDLGTPGVTLRAYAEGKN